MKYPKKLIEVALPLDDINRAAAREKSIRHGHPSTLHLWWARRPLAAARAVLFAQLVNDPGDVPVDNSRNAPDKKEIQRERDNLFEIIRDLVKWENTNDEEVLERARREIRKSWAETCNLTGEDRKTLPPFYDPFCGGGTIPLEAQRLGLEAHASDLNPVAVMITKALIEIPPKFSGRHPVGPIPASEEQIRSTETQKWSGAWGLAEDVRRYGHWVREQAFKLIGHLYPQLDLPNEYGGSKATVIAWLWARTVASPNPAYHGAHVPLVHSFWLSTKKGKEAWVEPVLSSDGMSYTFEVRSGEGDGSMEGTVNRSGGVCLLSKSPMPFSYIRAEGKADRMGQKLMAVIAEGPRGRIYLKATPEMEKTARLANPTWKPEGSVPERLTGGTCYGYGLTSWGHLFTPRQLVALTTFSDLVLEAREKVMRDAMDAGWQEDGKGLRDGGTGAVAYADAVSVYLAFAVDKGVNYWSSLCAWHTGAEKMISTFSRQALPMVWDFTEANPFSDSSGNFLLGVKQAAEMLDRLFAKNSGHVYQLDASEGNYATNNLVISSDPPYYDNIGYADLSDFFYVWMRRSLKKVFPEVFATLTVPKKEELVAIPYRHGGKEKADAFFIEGMTRAIHDMAAKSHPSIPVTIYYAFKQSDTESEGTASTGWETFLEAVITAGFAITGTWPMRTELVGNLKKRVNALASSIVLVCRTRLPDAETISRKQFLRELDAVLPEALEVMIGGKGGASPIAPVDLAQAAIGPGMAVYSKCKRVLEADGSAMTIRTALTIINRAIDEYFTDAESHMDSATRLCVDWFQQYGFRAGPFGEADVLARAKGTSVEFVKTTGVLEAGGGQVRLFRFSEYSPEWDPQSDRHVCIWEGTHQMIRALQMSEHESGQLLAKMADKAEPIRQLAYRLYTLCERKGWAEDARVYNELIASWHAIEDVSREAGQTRQQQDELEF